MTSWFGVLYKHVWNRYVLGLFESVTKIAHADVDELLRSCLGTQDVCHAQAQRC